VLEEKKKVEKCSTCSHSSRQHRDVDSNKLSSEKEVSSFSSEPPKVEQPQPTKEKPKPEPKKQQPKIEAPKPEPLKPQPKLSNEVKSVSITPPVRKVVSNFKRNALW
jgi:hypothetical protein